MLIMQLFLWPDLTFFRQRKSVMRKVHLLKKKGSLLIAIAKLRIRIKSQENLEELPLISLSV